jgi:hypothetical protein
VSNIFRLTPVVLLVEATNLQSARCRCVAGAADILVRPMKQDLGQAPSLRDFSKLCASPRSALPQSARSAVSRREVGLSAQLKRSIAGESFSAHVNRQRSEALRQLARHRAVSSAIIRPRTMNPLETDLAADDTDVSCDLLDRIDGIVPPGNTVRVADIAWRAAVWRRLWR